MHFKVPLLVLLLLFHFHGTVDTVSYTVGDGAGWSFGANSWSRNKTFVAGDNLTFNYYPPFHNVVKVNAAEYNSCTAPATATVLQSGTDTITLERGDNFFICTFPLHCGMGMRLAVNAL